jgi:arylsulfatase A-like enzyme
VCRPSPNDKLPTAGLFAAAFCSVVRSSCYTTAAATTPLCCPSRASILRGHYAHNTGLWRNDNDQPNGGASFDRLVANIDIAPTVLDLAGVEVPSWMDGRSFRSFLDGSAPESWRTSLLIENMGGAGEGQRPPYSGVRHQDEIYVEYASGEEEYYDLKVDPYQLENRPQDAPQAMNEALAALKDCAGDGCRKADRL